MKLCVAGSSTMEASGSTEVALTESPVVFTLMETELGADCCASNGAMSIATGGSAWIQMDCRGMPNCPMVCCSDVPRLLPIFWTVVVNSSVRFSIIKFSV